MPSQIGRRALLCGLAAIPGSAALVAAAAPPALATAADPIFAAIELHRAANAAHDAAIAEQGRLELEYGFDEGFDDLTEQPCHEENEAFEAMVSTVAATIPGLAAKLDYLSAIADGRDAWMLEERRCGALLIESFAATLRNVGVRQ